MIKINEIFYSIQGESSLAGTPTVFIRTSGCHLRCHYCDTKYAYYDGEKKSVDEIIDQIKIYPTKYVCVTGGEPLLQPASLELMTKLCDLGFIVSIETSGDLSCENTDSRVKKIVDIKTPDSGAPNAFHYDNLKLDGHDVEYKFVICSENDFNWAEAFCRQHEALQKRLVLYSPSHGQLDQKWLAEKILLEKSTARLQLQLHKYIWSADTRGV